MLMRGACVERKRSSGGLKGGGGRQRMSYVNRRRRGGYGGVVGTTLVELVVAMAIFALIIGAVAGVVVMMQTQGIRSSSAATAQNDGQTIETALAKAMRAVTVNTVGTPGGPVGTSTSNVNFFLACPYAAVFEASLPTPASPSTPETAMVYVYLTNQAGRPTYRIHVTAASRATPPTQSITTCPAGPGVTTVNQAGPNISGIPVSTPTQVLTDTGNVVATSPLFTYYDVTGTKLQVSGTNGAVAPGSVASVGVHLQTRVVPSNGGSANANPSTSINNRIYLANVAASSVPPAAQCYSSVVLADSPLAYWALNQPATVNSQPNTIVPDMSGNANRGTLQPGATGGALPGPLKCDPTQTATSFAPNTTSDAEPDTEQGVYDEPTHAYNDGDEPNGVKPGGSPDGDENQYGDGDEGCSVFCGSDQTQGVVDNTTVRYGDGEPDSDEPTWYNGGWPNYGDSEPDQDINGPAWWQIHYQYNDTNNCFPGGVSGNYDGCWNCPDTYDGSCQWIGQWYYGCWSNSWSYNCGWRWNPYWYVTEVDYWWADWADEPWNYPAEDLQVGADYSWADWTNGPDYSWADWNPDFIWADYVGDYSWADKTGGYMSTNMKQSNLTSYTIAAWIKTGTTPQGWATILSARGSLGGCNGGLSLNMASGGQPFAILDGNCYPPIGVVDNGVNLANNQWHFVVATWTGVKYTPITANQFSLYVDGKLVSTTPVGNPGWTGPMAPFTSSGNVSVGWNGSAYWYRFMGDIAQVSVYNYPLSPQQTATQFLAACPGANLGQTCPGQPW